MSFGDNEDDNIINNNNWLESLEAQTDFPSVLVDWLDFNKENATNNEDEENIFVEKSFMNNVFTEFSQAVKVSYGMKTLNCSHWFTNFISAS